MSSFERTPQPDTDVFQPNSNESRSDSDEIPGGWGDVAALADAYEDRSDAAEQSANTEREGLASSMEESPSPSVQEEPTFHIRLSSGPIPNRPLVQTQAKEDARQQALSAYRIKLGKFYHEPVAPKQESRPASEASSGALSAASPEFVAREKSQEGIIADQSFSPQASRGNEALKRQSQSNIVPGRAAVGIAEQQLELNKFQMATLDAKMKEFKAAHGVLGRRFGKNAGEYQDFKRQLKFLNKQRAELEKELAAAREQYAAGDVSAAA